MAPYKKLSNLSNTILGWQNKANETMDLDATYIYLQAWKEVFDMLSIECRKFTTNEFRRVEG